MVTPEEVFPEPGGFASDLTEPSYRIKGDDLHRLSWQQFESLCAELFSKENRVSSCWLTQTGQDYGADVLLMSGKSGELIQCKHTKGTKYDGYEAIQQVYSACVKYSEELGIKIEKLIFATNAKRLSINVHLAFAMLYFCLQGLILNPGGYPKGTNIFLIMSIKSRLVFPKALENSCSSAFKFIEHLFPSRYKRRSLRVALMRGSVKWICESAM